MGCPGFNSWKSASENWAVRRAPMHRSIASRIVVFPPSPDPIRQFRPGDGYQSRAIMPLKFRIPMCLIRAISLSYRPAIGGNYMTKPSRSYRRSAGDGRMAAIVRSISPADRPPPARTGSTGRGRWRSPAFRIDRPRSGRAACGRSSFRDRSAAKMLYQAGAEAGEIATDNLKPRRTRASLSDASVGISTTGELSPICDSISGRLTAVTSPLT